MKLPNPSGQYNPDWQARTNTLVERMDEENVKKGRDNYLGDGRVILTAPDGGLWALQIDEDGFVTSINVQTGEENQMNLDAFQRLRVSQPTTLFDSQQEYGLDTLRIWDASANGTLSYSTGSSNGSVTSGSNAVGPRNADTRMVPVTVSTTDAHYSILQSRQYVRYIPGKSHLILMTGVFAPASGFSPSIVRRTKTSGSVVDNSVAQASWNVDKFDGTGPSAKTIDFTKTQILFIDAQWLGVGRVCVGFDIDGKLYPAHEFNNANSLTVPYTQTFNLPVRLEVRNTSATTTVSRAGYFDGDNGIFLENSKTGVSAPGGTIQFVCCSVQSEGGEETRGFSQAVSNGTTAIAVTTRRSVLSIRPKATYNSITNRGHVEIADIALKAKTNDAYWELVIGGTLGGVPSWAGVGANSCVEYDIAGTTVTGGITVAAGYVISGSGAKAGDTFSQADLRGPLTISQIDALSATQPIMSLVCTSVSGTSDVGSVMKWHEQVI